MRVFEVLKNKRKRRAKSKSLERIFYKENSYLLNKYPYFNNYISHDHDFAIIESNIICRALLNKEAIDKVVKDYKKECFKENKKIDKTVLRERVDIAIRDLPYLNDDDHHRIYIPIFSKSLNIIYVDEPEKLLKYPYSELLEDFSSSIIDPFELYNYNLYDSFFSKMIRSVSDETSCAFFNVDDYVIYVINSQGKLDIAIYLFDRYCFRFNMKEIMIRVNHLMETFYNNERSTFVVELYRQRFISYRLYRYLLRRLD